MAVEVVFDSGELVETVAVSVVAELAAVVVFVVAESVVVTVFVVVGTAGVVAEMEIVAEM